MSQIVVPVKINPHLIPFFYEEFEGIEANYTGTKVKACKINGRSSLGFLLMTALKESDVPVNIERSKFWVYITYDQECPEAVFHFTQKGKNQFLQVQKEVLQKINYILEDQFRIAFVYTVKGMLKADKTLLVRDAIQAFMVDYELDEFGFDLESLRRLLNRGSDQKLSRLQTQMPHAAFKKTVSEN